jgi:hypothetical protein
MWAPQYPSFANSPFFCKTFQVFERPILIVTAPQYVYETSIFPVTARFETPILQNVKFTPRIDCSMGYYPSPSYLSPYWLQFTPTLTSTIFNARAGDYITYNPNPPAGKNNINIAFKLHCSFVHTYIGSYVVIGIHVYLYIL